MTVPVAAKPAVCDMNTSSKLRRTLARSMLIGILLDQGGEENTWSVLGKWWKEFIVFLVGK